jgi:hypothetical protein
VVSGTVRRTHDQPEVHRITSARSSLAEDIAARNKRYMLQMSTRVVCFLGAVAIEHWTRWVLLVGAVFLPYIAVVLANAGRERGTDPGTYIQTDVDTRALPGPPPIDATPEDRTPGGPRT